MWRGGKHRGRGTVAWIAAAMVLLAIVGYSALRSGKGDVASDKHVAKYYLVSGHGNDFSIYVIETPSVVETVGRWINEHVNSSEAVQKARGLVLTFWHHELLRYAEHDSVIWSDFLSDPDVVLPTDLPTLESLFQEHGARVDTVPGRKPPKRSTNPRELILIEKDDGNEIGGRS